MADVQRPAPEPDTPVTDPEAAALLIRLQSDITRAVEAMDNRLAYAAFDLGKTGLNDTAAHGVLANLSVVDPSIADCVAVDGGGTIVAAEPAAYHGTSCQVMIIQTDGRVLYDTDPTQVGRLTFEDPLYADYPDLLDVARRVADERYGTATYGFAADGEEAVQKKTAWTTTGLHGTEWRVAVIDEV